MLEMQDPKTGVKSQPQKLVITTIPHAITGKHTHTHKEAHRKHTQWIDSGCHRLGNSYFFPCLELNILSP